MAMAMAMAACYMEECSTYMQKGSMDPTAYLRAAPQRNGRSRYVPTSDASDVHRHYHLHQTHVTLEVAI